MISVRARSVGDAMSLYAGTVPSDVVSQRSQQRGEGAVEVVAIAALLIPDDPPSRFVGVDRRRAAELDLQGLVWHPLHVCPMHGEETGDRRRAWVRHPEPAQVSVDVNAMHQPDGSVQALQAGGSGGRNPRSRQP